MPKQTSFDLEDAKALLSQLTEFYRTLWQEWKRVSNQWENLKAVWHDEQFDKFELLFDKLSTAYDDAIKDCEKYISFLDKEIQIAESEKEKLGSLLKTNYKKVVAASQIVQAIISPPIPPPVYPTNLPSYKQESVRVKKVIHPFFEYVKQQKKREVENRKKEIDISASVSNSPKTFGSPDPNPPE